jgi:hypothetical protein
MIFAFKMNSRIGFQRRSKFAQGLGVLVDVARPTPSLYALGVALSCGGQSESQSLAVEAGLGSDAAYPEGGDGAGQYLDGSVDGSACFVEVPNYDQSCAVDSDCVAVIAGSTLTPVAVIQSGDYCSQGLCICGGEAINKGAVPQYIGDISKTPVGSGAIALGGCSCGSTSTLACCSAGHCVTDQCSTGLLDAGSLRGVSDAAPPEGSVLCGPTGPLDAGLLDSGSARWCDPPEQCVQFNGMWACCVLPAVPGQGVAFCVGIPGNGDGGSP